MLWFEILAGAWFFAFGAVIGSFLNVVVWRTPRGETLVGPSRCPKCGTAIRWYNNVPVFGWIWLGGKCRDCKLPISPRYPIVEFICGAMFLAVALAELATHNLAFPNAFSAREAGFAQVILDPHWPQLAAFALHMLLLCALLAWALMQVDEQRIPVKQIASLWLIGFIAAAIWPGAAVPPVADGTINNDAISRAWRGLLHAAIGFLVGGSIGAPLALLWHWLSRRDVATTEQPWVIAVALASVGLVLGGEAAVIVALLAIVLRGVSALAVLVVPALRRVPLTMDIFVATLVQVCCAKYLVFTPLAG